MEFQIKEEEKKKRLDVFLSEKLENITRSYLKSLIEEEQVLVNGKRQKAGYLLKEGDTLTVNLPEEKEASIQPENIPLEILYEDEDILIVNKEKGMVVHPANGNYTGTMVNALMYSHKDRLSSINGVIRPGIVHRIDKDTSGILVVAKNDQAHKILSEQFKEHHITRQYIALVKGIIKEEQMEICLPIGRSTKDRKKMAVTDKNSKEAITHVQVIKRYENSHMTLVQVTLETGRTHQIRVHMAYKGHPLVGDEVYGKKDSLLKVEGQMLHAQILGFIHPRTGKYVEFQSPLPKEYQEVLHKLDKREGEG